MKSIKILLASLILIFSITSYSQDECGFAPNAEMVKILDLEWTLNKETYLRSENHLRNEWIELPITIHSNVEGNSNDLTLFENALIQLNKNFESAKIKFTTCRILNDKSIPTSVNTFGYSSNRFHYFSRKNIPYSINIYIVDRLSSDGGFTYISGVATLPFSSNIPHIVIKRDALATNVLTHEMGHYLGLYHTFGPNNACQVQDELVNGTNCEYAGDRICDTPASPCCSGVVDANCIYFGTKTDKNGESFTPDVSNFMEYTLDKCRTNFTPEQILKMRYFASQYEKESTCYIDPSKYCDSYAKYTTKAWIDTVKINSFVNVSEGNTGYSLYVKDTIRLVSGMENYLSISPGFACGNDFVKIRLYLDLNRDNDFFDAGEIIFDSYESNSFNNFFKLPKTISSGLTRMRVSLSYADFFIGNESNYFPPMACEIINQGEIEDYVIHLEAKDYPFSYSEKYTDTDSEYYFSEFQVNDVFIRAGTKEYGLRVDTSIVTTLQRGRLYQFNCTSGGRLYIDYYHDNDPEIAFDIDKPNGTAKRFGPWDFRIPRDSKLGKTYMLLAGYSTDPILISANIIDSIPEYNLKYIDHDIFYSPTIQIGKTLIRTPLFDDFRKIQFYNYKVPVNWSFGFKNPLSLGSTKAVDFKQNYTFDDDVYPKSTLDSVKSGLEYYISNYPSNNIFKVVIKRDSFNYPSLECPPIKNDNYLFNINISEMTCYNGDSCFISWSRYKEDSLTTLVWIDFNKDGIFSNDEVIFNKNNEENPKTVVFIEDRGKEDTLIGRTVVYSNKYFQNEVPNPCDISIKNKISVKDFYLNVRYSDVDTIYVGSEQAPIPLLRSTINDSITKASDLIMQIGSSYYIKRNNDKVIKESDLEYAINIGTKYQGIRKIKKIIQAARVIPELSDTLFLAHDQISLDLNIGYHNNISIKSLDDWCTVKLNGNLLEIRCTENASLATRSARINIINNGNEYQKLLISQTYKFKAKVLIPYIETEYEVIDLPNKLGDTTVTVFSNVRPTFSIGSNNNIIHIAYISLDTFSISSESCSRSLLFTYLANPTNELRYDSSLVFKAVGFDENGKSITVTKKIILRQGYVGTYTIDNISDAQSINIYPNPTDNIISSVIENFHYALQPYYNISIFDFRGRKRLNKIQKTKSMEIDISSLEAGIYIIQYNNGIEVINKKLVKI